MFETVDVSRHCEKGIAVPALDRDSADFPRSVLSHQTFGNTFALRGVLIGAVCLFLLCRLSHAGVRQMILMAVTAEGLAAAFSAALVTN
jgi:hypothetical protein